MRTGTEIVNPFIIAKTLSKLSKQANEKIEVFHKDE